MLSKERDGRYDLRAPDLSSIRLIQGVWRLAISGKIDKQSWQTEIGGCTRDCGNTYGDGFFLVADSR